MKKMTWALVLLWFVVDLYSMDIHCLVPNDIPMFTYHRIQYPIACGMIDEDTGKSVTPLGEFKVIGKGIVDEKNSIYGTRVIVLNYLRHGKHLCIHGTNEPRKIGKHVSNMCIRMKNSDVEELYKIIQKGDTVAILE